MRLFVVKTFEHSHFLWPIIIIEWNGTRCRHDAMANKCVCDDASLFAFQKVPINLGLEKSMQCKRDKECVPRQKRVSIKCALWKIDSAQNHIKLMLSIVMEEVASRSLE